MAGVELIDRKVLGTTVQEWTVDHGTDRIVTSLYGDDSNLFAANRELRKTNGGGFGEMTKLADISIWKYRELQRLGIADDQKEFHKWLKSDEGRLYMVKDCKI